jgi:hypothetical protein
MEAKMMNMKAFFALYGISIVFIFTYLWAISTVIELVQGA